MTLEQRIAVIEKWVDTVDNMIVFNNKRLAALENNQKQTPQIIELEIEWPEADIDSLHFNRQWTKGVFDLKEDGWYHSRNILFMSARNIEDDNSDDILSDYLTSSYVNEVFCQALKEAGVIEENDVEISLPKENEGIKKYNGVEWHYWLLPPASGSATIFCAVGGSGNAGCLTASSVYGCAPSFRVA